MKNQNKRINSFLLLIVIAMTMLANITVFAQEELLSEPTLQRQNELVYMLRQDCGSCHGMTLKGGLGPSLLPQRMSVLPDQYLIDVITLGRHGTPMPPWAPILSQQDIRWIVKQLKQGLNDGFKPVGSLQ